MSQRRPQAVGRAAAAWLPALLAASAAWGQAAPPATPATPAGAITDYAAAYAARCASCHGADGVSRQALTPSLAGQHSFYAITQLFLFRDGRRDNPVMTAVAKPMSDDDLRGFSDHIATLAAAPPALRTPPDPARVARGGALAQRLHCLACHGPQLAGAQQVPRLAGQREDYLQAALRGFRSGQRVGYTTAMSEALAGTSPDDLDDLAHLLAHAPTHP